VESPSYLLLQTFLIQRRLFLLVSHGLLSESNFGLGLHFVVEQVNVIDDDDDDRSSLNNKTISKNIVVGHMASEIKIPA
jgi:hypothetical protein